MTGSQENRKEKTKIKVALSVYSKNNQNKALTSASQEKFLIPRKTNLTTRDREMHYCANDHSTIEIEFQRKIGLTCCKSAGAVQLMPVKRSRDVPLHRRLVMTSLPRLQFCCHVRSSCLTNKRLNI